MNRKSKIIAITASAVYVLDRLTKIVVMDNFAPDRSMPVISGFFDITLVHNTGAAFGLFSLARDSVRVPLLLLSTLAAIGILLYFVKKTKPGNTFLLLALALLIGGALGNLTDRLLYGHVVDFIDWHWREVYHWPAFNIADSGITAGIFLLAVEVFIRDRSADEEKLA